MDNRKTINNQTVDIKDSLKDYFDKLGLTQQQIADKLGVSQPAVGALLNGKPFGKKTAAKWGDLFNIQPSWLLTGEGEMLKNTPLHVESQHCSNMVSIPLEVLNLLLLQQKTIDDQAQVMNSQQRTIEELSKKV